MSAVVQELSLGLRAALAAEWAALSDPVEVFWAKPEASELVLTCSRLPLKHQNTHGLKVKLPDCYPERLGCVSKLSCPGWMALLSREPTGTGGPAEDDGTHSGRLAERGSFQDTPREGLGAAGDMADIAVESRVPFPLTSAGGGCSEEKAPWLTPEGRGSFLRPSSTPRAALLQSLGRAHGGRGVRVSRFSEGKQWPSPGRDAPGEADAVQLFGVHSRLVDVEPCPGREMFSEEFQNPDESPAKGQATLENLSKAILEAPGMTADGTTPFSKTEEERTRGSVAVPPGSREWDTDLDAVNDRVPEISTFVPRELLQLPNDGSRAKGQWSGEEEYEHLATPAPSSASRNHPSLLRGLFGPGEGLRTTFSSCLPAQQEETNVCDATSTAPVLQSKVPFEASLANRHLEPSAHFLSERDVEFGTMPWEDSVDVQVVCQVQEGGCAGGDGSLTSSNCGKVVLLEEWASEPKTEGTPSQMESSDEQSSDSESERGTDHAYSCLGRRTWGYLKVASEQQSITEDVQKGLSSGKEGPAAALRMVSPGSSVSRLHDGLCLTHPASSGRSRVEKNHRSQCPLSQVGGLVLGPKEGRTLLGEAGSCHCFRSSLKPSEGLHPSSSSSSSSSDSGGLDRDLRKGHLMEMETGSRHGAGLPGRSSRTQLHPSWSSEVEASSVADKECSKTAPVGGEPPLARQEEGGVRGLEVSGSWLEGRPLGTRAMVAAQDTRDLLLSKETFSSACWAGSCSVPESGGLEQTAELTPGREEEKVAEAGRGARSQAQSPREQSKDDSCVAKETCCTLSEDAPQDGLNVRAQADRDGGHRLGASPAFVPEKNATLPWGRSAGDSHACLTYQGPLELLSGLEDATDALGPAERSHPDLSVVAASEAETQRPGCVFLEPKKIPGHGHSVFAPGANLQQNPRTGTSLVVELGAWDAGETVTTKGGHQGCVSAEKHTQSCNLEEAALPELVSLMKGQGKEDVEGNPCSGSSFPPGSLLSGWRPRLDSRCPVQVGAQGSSWLLVDLCPADPEQPRDTVGQMETELCGPQNQHRLNCLVWFEQKKEALEAAASEHSPLPWVSSEKQKVDPVLETVTRSPQEAPEQTSCSRQESQGLALPVSALSLEKNFQETFQQSTGGSSEKRVPELTNNRTEDDPKELKGLESPRGTLTREHLVNDHPHPVRMEESCPVPAVLRGDPSDGLGGNQFLKCDDKPASPPGPACSRPANLLSLIPVDRERSAWRGPPESFQDQGRARLARGSSGAQPLQTPAPWRSQRDGLRTGSSSETLPSPHAEGYSSGTFLVESKNEGQACLLVSEKDHIRSSVQEATCVDSALDPEETGVRSEGCKSRAGRIVPRTFGSPDPSLKEMEPSQEGDRKESHPAMDAEEYSAVLLQDLVFPMGMEEKGRTARQLPWASLRESPLECGLAEAPDPSRSTEDTERLEGSQSHAGQLFPGRNIFPETLSGLMSFPSRDSSASEASTLGLRREGKGRQVMEGNGKPPGDPEEPPEGLSGSPVNEVPVKTDGAAGLQGGPSLSEKTLGAEVGLAAAQAGGMCEVLRRRKRTTRKARAGASFRRRILAVGSPLGSASFRMTASPEDLEHRFFLTRSWLSRNEKGGPGSAFREPGRPKRSELFRGPRQREGARSPNLGFREYIRPSKDKVCPLPGLCLCSTWVGFSSKGNRRTFESTHRIKSSLLFQRQARKKVPTLGRSKAPAKPLPLVNPTSLRHFSEMVPGPRSQHVDPVCSATPLAARRSEGATAWDSLPKHRGIPGSRLDPFGLSGRAKDPLLLQKLSLLADQLQAPLKNSPKRKPLRPSSELLPVPEKHGSQKLPEIFSCINIQLSSPGGEGSRCCFQMFRSQPLALYPVEATQVCIFGLYGKPPLAFSGPVFPISFHVPTDPGPAKNLLGREPLKNVSQRGDSGQAPGWTFAFLLAQSCLNILPTQKDARFSSLNAAKAQLGAAVVQNIRGLQTILALLSPGCSRLWTKKRPLATRSPSGPKPTLLQFARGLKGLRSDFPSVSAGLFSSSVPSSQGRVLSLRRLQGPSAGPPKLPSLLSTHRCCYKWEPGPASAVTWSLGNCCATLPLGPDQFPEASVAVKEETRWEHPFPVLPPTSRPGLSTPEFQAHRSDALDVSAPVLPQSDSPLEKAGSKKRPKKVSQIRIRKTIPKPDPNLTPMGLPRPKRLKKTEFSLEEIYTNQNYKSPPTTRCLETIFEEPKERNGTLVSISHQKRKRILEFQDFTIPRKRKARGRVKVAGSFTRAQKAALEGQELDVLLIQKLMDLEAFFASQEEPRDVPGS